MVQTRTTFATIAIAVATSLGATVTLQQGTNNYNGVDDTQICSASMVASHEEYGSTSHNEAYEKIHLHRC